MAEFNDSWRDSLLSHELLEGEGDLDALLGSRLEDELNRSIEKMREDERLPQDANKCTESLQVGNSNQGNDLKQVGNSNQGNDLKVSRPFGDSLSGTLELLEDIEMPTLTGSSCDISDLVSFTSASPNSPPKRVADAKCLVSSLRDPVKSESQPKCQLLEKPTKEADICAKIERMNALPMCPSSSTVSNLVSIDETSAHQMTPTTVSSDSLVWDDEVFVESNAFLKDLEDGTNKKSSPLDKRMTLGTGFDIIDVENMNDSLLSSMILATSPFKLISSSSSGARSSTGDEKSEIGRAKVAAFSDDSNNKDDTLEQMAKALEISINFGKAKHKAEANTDSTANDKKATVDERLKDECLMNLRNAPNSSFEVHKELAVKECPLQPSADQKIKVFDSTFDNVTSKTDVVNMTYIGSDRPAVNTTFEHKDRIDNITQVKDNHQRANTTFECNKNELVNTTFEKKENPVANTTFGCQTAESAEGQKENLNVTFDRGEYKIASMNTVVNLMDANFEALKVILDATPKKNPNGAARTATSTPKGGEYNARNPTPKRTVTKDPTQSFMYRMSMGAQGDLRGEGNGNVDEPLPGQTAAAALPALPGKGLGCIKQQMVAGRLRRLGGSSAISGASGPMRALHLTGLSGGVKNSDVAENERPDSPDMVVFAAGVGAATPDVLRCSSADRGPRITSTPTMGDRGPLSTLDGLGGQAPTPIMAPSSRLRFTSIASSASLPDEDMKDSSRSCLSQASGKGSRELIGTPASRANVRSLYRDPYPSDLGSSSVPDVANQVAETTDGSSRLNEIMSKNPLNCNITEHQVDRCNDFVPAVNAECPKVVESCIQEKELSKESCTSSVDVKHEALQANAPSQVKINGQFESQVKINEISESQVKINGDSDSRSNSNGLLESQKKHDGHSESQINNNGLSESQMKDTGHSKSQVINNGPSESQTKNNGYSESEVKNNGLSESQMKDNGLSKSQVINNGLSESQTKNNEQSESEVKNNGLSESHMKDNGHSKSQVINNGLSESQMKNNGHSESKVKNNGLSESQDPVYGHSGIEKKSEDALLPISSDGDRKGVKSAVPDAFSFSDKALTQDLHSVESSLKLSDGNFVNDNLVTVASSNRVASSNAEGSTLGVVCEKPAKKAVKPSLSNEGCKSENSVPTKSLRNLSLKPQLNLAKSSLPNKSSGNPVKQSGHSQESSGQIIRGTCSNQSPSNKHKKTANAHQLPSSVTKRSNKENNAGNGGQIGEIKKTSLHRGVLAPLNSLNKKTPSNDHIGKKQSLDSMKKMPLNSDHQTLQMKPSKAHEAKEVMKLQKIKTTVPDPSRANQPPVRGLKPPNTIVKPSSPSNGSKIKGASVTRPHLGSKLPVGPSVSSGLPSRLGAKTQSIGVVPVTANANAKSASGLQYPSKVPGVQQSSCLKLRSRSQAHPQLKNVSTTRGSRQVNAPFKKVT